MICLSTVGEESWRIHHRLHLADQHGLTNQHLHSIWVSHPACGAFDSSCLQRSTSHKCIQEKNLMSNVKFVQHPLLHLLFFSSIYLHRPLSFCCLSLFCPHSSPRSNFHPNRSKCNQFEPDSKWLLLPRLQLCILLVLWLHLQEGLTQLRQLFSISSFVHFPRFFQQFGSQS